MRKMRVQGAWAAGALLVLVHAGCADGDPIEPAEKGEDAAAGDGGVRADGRRDDEAGVHMRLGPLTDGFYAQPWPLATRLRGDGTPEMAGFTMPAAASFVAENLETLARNTHGFATTGAIFASFDG